MIWTALLAARSFLAKIPWPVWAIAAVLLTGWLYGNHRYSEGVADERAKWEAAAAKAVAQARKADEAGLTTAAGAKATSAVEIQRGREAAKDAPDPWKAATEAMR